MVNTQAEGVHTILLEIGPGALVCRRIAGLVGYVLKVSARFIVSMSGSESISTRRTLIHSIVDLARRHLHHTGHCIGPCILSLNFLHAKCLQDFGVIIDHVISRDLQSSSISYPRYLTLNSLCCRDRVRAHKEHCNIDCRLNLSRKRAQEAPFLAHL